ncbi:MAG: TRAM domain-containing protein, partial [Gemmatimonadaceae bacterium]
MSETVARVEIASVAAGGDGVGRTDGMVVFVPRTAPADVARVRFTAGRRFARGVLESLEVPSPARIDPPCPHYIRDRCGGCQIQHINYEAQLAAKAQIIGDALRR